MKVEGTSEDMENGVDIAKSTKPAKLRASAAAAVSHEAGIVLTWPWRVLWSVAGFHFVLNEVGVTKRAPKPISRCDESSVQWSWGSTVHGFLSDLLFRRSYVNFVRVFNWVCFFLCLGAFFEHLIFETSGKRGPIFQGMYIQIILIICHVHVNLGWEASLNVLGYRLWGAGAGDGVERDCHTAALFGSSRRQWRVYPEIEGVEHGVVVTRCETPAEPAADGADVHNEKVVSVSPAAAKSLDELPVSIDGPRLREVFPSPEKPYDLFARNSCGQCLRELLTGAPKSRAQRQLETVARGSRSLAARQQRSAYGGIAADSDADETMEGMILEESGWTSERVDDHEFFGVATPQTVYGFYLGLLLLALSVTFALLAPLWLSVAALDEFYTGSASFSLRAYSVLYGVQMTLEVWTVGFVLFGTTGLLAVLLKTHHADISMRVAELRSLGAAAGLLSGRESLAVDDVEIGLEEGTVCVFVSSGVCGGERKQ